jgi:hypothetical protein
MKRLLSAVLCICLIFALVIPCAASQPSFRDADEIDHWEQVCMLYDLGLISGYGNGTFDPDGYITRAEAAKIVAMILDANAGRAGQSSFPDMADHWASAYVRYCTDQGLFSGFSDGNFHPSRNITARQLTKILLVAIGCNADNYVGSGWADAVDRDATDLGLYAGVRCDLDDDVTRDNACMLIFNALNCYAVQEDENGVRTYVTDQLMNPVTILENRYGVVRYEEFIEANEYADLTDAGNHLDAGFTKIHGHREFAVSTDRTMLGRWMGICVVGNAVVGVPYYSAEEVSATYASMEALRAAMTRDEQQFTRDTVYYVNYAAATADDLNSLGDVAEITIIDRQGDGDIDMVLAVSYVSATVVDGRALTLQLDEVPTAEPEKTADTETAEATEAAAAEDTAETVENTGTITADQLIDPPSRLHDGDQVWVASIGGRYLLKTEA